MIPDSLDLRNGTRRRLSNFPSSSRHVYTLYLVRKGISENEKEIIEVKPLIFESIRELSRSTLERGIKSNIFSKTILIIHLAYFRVSL